jgi:flagellar FliL protein
MSDESPSVRNNSDKGRGKIRNGLAVGLVAFVLLAVASWFLFSKTRAESQRPSTAVPAVRDVLHLEGFVVNLADPPGDSFLRIGMDLGLGRPLKGHGEKDAGVAPTAQVRDVILRVLTTYQSNDLLVPAGKIRLKQQLLESLQAAIPELAVREVYFTDFLVQH